MCRLLAAALLLLLSHAAQAGRPLQSEDAGVLERGRCELETAFARLDPQRGEPRQDAGYAQIACGAGGQTQLALAPGFERGDGRANTLTATGKTALRPLTDHQAGVLLAYSLIGSQPRHQGLRLAGSAARLVVTMPRGPWLLHANVGVLHNHDSGRDSTLWALAAERTALGGLDLLAEVFGDDRDRTPWLNAGVRWRLVDERLSLDASYGVQTNGARARLATVGLKLLF
ncbi:MAG: hypothetical protein ING50_16420 [Burkholderiales bacterium]|nr:hypothetical protein [Burkholderiales bacterium]